MIRVLLIEDDEDDYILTRGQLSEANRGRFELIWAPTYEEGRKALETCSFDVILMDYDLGSQNGLELTREANRMGCKAPIILLTGRETYEIDIEAMKSGVADFLSKSEVTPRLLDRTIRYAMLHKQNEEDLLKIKEDLENRVFQRTSELIHKNRSLEVEIQERQRIEAELAEVQRRLLDRAEAERLELARELHDGPMQDLYSIIFGLEGNQSNGSSSTEIKGKILEVIQALRSISRELRPPALTPHGLQKAIQSHIDNLRQAHPSLMIEANLEADGATLAEPVRMALYRIYQVAVTNVIRHANATRIDVRMSIKPDEICLEIQDNGRGFNLPARWIELARRGHLGLVGAAERAEAAGGKLHIESRPGEGTLICVIVPPTPTQLPK